MLGSRFTVLDTGERPFRLSRSVKFIPTFGPGMPSTLTCAECGQTETVELQVNEPEMRVYLPKGAIEPENDPSMGFLMMADDAWFEDVGSDIVLCARCSDDLANGDGLGERDGDSVRIEVDIDELED